MLRSALRYRDDQPRIEGLTRHEACVHYQGKVLLLARRLVERLPSDSSVQLEDLVGYGSIGLLEAFDRYDGGRNIQFSTFAEHRIRGAMLDALRKNDTFTRRRRQLAKRVEHATVTVRTELGRDPEPQEVADYLGIDIEDYWQAVQRTTPVNLVSIDANSRDGDNNSRPLVEQICNPNQPMPDHRLQVDWLKDELKGAIGELAERERQCILMYYGKDLSLAEIAAVFDVTASRISQILSKARGRLRKKLGDRLDQADLEVLQ